MIQRYLEAGKTVALVLPAGMIYAKQEDAAYCSVEFIENKIQGRAAGAVLYDDYEP